MNKKITYPLYESLTALFVLHKICNVDEELLTLNGEAS